MKVFCITQARLGSTRLAGKVLLPIAGVSLIDCHMQRVAQSELVDHHILATSTKAEDKPLIDYANEHQYLSFAGSEDDVLDRFYQAALDAGAKDEDLIVRLTGDCPLICPEFIDKTVRAHIENNIGGYSCLNLDTYPRGFDTEVFSLSLLRQAHESAKDKHDREHVTLFIYAKMDVQILSVGHGDERWHDYRLCVDEPADLLLIEKLANLLGNQWLKADGDTICRLLDESPELVLINKKIEQKFAHEDNLKQNLIRKP